MPFQQHEQTGLVWFTADVLNEIPHGFSTRKGGVSPAPWDSLNLRPGQGDGPEKLRENYRRFFAALDLDETRAVLSQQTHTANIRTVTAEDAGKGLLRPRDYTDVDALITNIVIFDKLFKTRIATKHYFRINFSSNKTPPYITPATIPRIITLVMTKSSLNT